MVRRGPKARACNLVISCAFRSHASLSSRNITHSLARSFGRPIDAPSAQARCGRETREISLTRIWRPCRACEHPVPRRLRPQLPPRERAGAAGAGAVGTGGEPDPFPRGVDCDEDRERHGHYHVGRIVLRHHRHLRPRGNPRAARHRRTAIINNTHLLTRGSITRYVVLWM